MAQNFDRTNKNPPTQKTPQSAPFIAAEETEEEKLEKLNMLYLFRYPFSITAMNWGLVLGACFGARSYYIYRRPLTALVSGFSATVIVGFPIFGYLMLKNLVVANSMKRQA